MFDIFYFGSKPNVAPFELPASSLEEAANKSKTEFFWYIYGGNDYNGFNFYVKPAPWEQEHVYVYGSQWQRDAGVYLAHKNHAQNKVWNFRADSSVTRLIGGDNWHIPSNIKHSTVDMSWHPDPHEPPFIYHLPSQWQSSSGVTYTVPGATTIKLVSDFEVLALPTKEYWNVPTSIDMETVDFSWHPNALDDGYIYHFPSQWQSSSGVTYTVPGAREIKLIDDFKVTANPTKENWNVPVEINATTVDFSWHPNTLDGGYIYHFPSKHQSASGVSYTVPGAKEIKLVDDFVVESLANTERWTVPEDIDVNTVDFTWIPNVLDPPFIYHFSDDYQDSSGLVYTAPGATQIKLIDLPGAKAKTLDIFFLDKFNAMSSTRFDALKTKYPHIQKVRYANSIIETIKRCVARSSTGRFWVISSEINYDDFDFNWHPSSWQGYMTHIFGSKWEKWSDTYLINKLEFDRNIKWAKSISEFPNLNFVNNQHVTIPEDLYDVYYIDHNNTSAGIKQKFPNSKTTRFVDNYLDTLKRIITTATTEYIWVTSSLCDYSKFDFSWQPEPWQAKMLHVFPSNQQKFGDTFYIHVDSFKQQMDNLELLEWFDTVNFCSEQTVPRVAFDNVVFTSDSVVDAIKQHQFTTPYATFTNNGSSVDYTPSMWRKQDRAVHSFTQGGSISIVPRDIQAILSSQVYDYPYIVKHKEHYRAEKALDIVYISNGEPDAERWYEHTCRVAGRTVKRVQNVNGRSQAYKAAANASNTPWFFTVFAKLQMVDNFNWAWQPDRLQEAKHYIFNARNPVNGLEYGHQGMIVYNKRLVLDTEQSGLDFTLSKAHEVVPVLSGTAHFNQDAWTTWRTAFRETLKLKQFMAESPTMETEHRLNVWLTVATGDYAGYCLSGAQDAIEYYKEVAGDYQQLMESFEWDWLKERFNRLCKN
jgi:hypothetical protein